MIRRGNLESEAYTKALSFFLCFLITKVIDSERIAGFAFEIPLTISEILSFSWVGKYSFR